MRSLSRALIEVLPLGVEFFEGADGDADVLRKLFVLNTAGTGGQLLRLAEYLSQE